jgi:hypothetical protein
MTIGTASKISWQLDGDFAKVPRTLGSEPRNLVFLSDNQKQYAITGREAAAAIGVNDSIHLTGEATGDHLAHVSSVTYCWWGSAPYHPFQQVCGGKADVGKGCGDSGGPDYYNGLAMGITSASDAPADCSGRGTLTAFSFAEYGEDELNIHICINSACDI